MEEPREVVEVGPEEHAPRGSGSEGETEEPFKRGFGAAPEPARVADLSGGGGECSGENSGGDEGHGEAVDCREVAEWDGAAAGEED